MSSIYPESARREQRRARGQGRGDRAGRCRLRRPSCWPCRGYRGGLRGQGRPLHRHVGRFPLRGRRGHLLQMVRQDASLGPSSTRLGLRLARAQPREDRRSRPPGRAVKSGAKVIGNPGCYPTASTLGSSRPSASAWPRATASSSTRSRELPGRARSPPRPRTIRNAPIHHALQDRCAPPRAGDSRRARGDGGLAGRLACSCLTWPRWEGASSRRSTSVWRGRWARRLCVKPMPSSTLESRSSASCPRALSRRTGT